MKSGELGGGGTQRGVVVQRLSPAREVTAALTARAVRLAAGERPIKSIAIGLMNDEQIAGLHEQFMGDPSPTDVLTFDLREGPEIPEVEGDIAVSVETARRQARRFRTDARSEILRYVVHGVLHLLGYDDHTPSGRARMRREENRVLKMLQEPARGRRARAGRTSARVS